MRADLKCSEALARRLGAKPAMMTSINPFFGESVFYEAPDNNVIIATGRMVLIWPLVPDEEQA